jgi:ABC-type phosphate/phosphonate transport system substrate-binding protein
MYDLPEVRAATDAWWRGLAQAFRREGIAEVPDALDRSVDSAELWLRPDLLFSQTCGYPLKHRLDGRVALVATPRYAADGCDGPNYCSMIIVHARRSATGIADLRGVRCAINSRDSQSGCNALRALVAGLAEGGRFFRSVIVSGSHAASVALVASGDADVAAVDCVTYALLTRHRASALAETRVLCRTPTAPGLPYITRARAGDALLCRLRAGLDSALADAQLSQAREELLLWGVDVLPLAAYDRVTELEESARAAGYREIA